MSPLLNGSTFAAEIPYADPNSVENSDRRILVVDDNEAIRENFAECLSERYVCSTAANADEALVQLMREPYGLVITDVRMPGRSGVELLREIMARLPDTSVIIVSEIDRMQRVLDTLRLGAFDYLFKPCELHVLELCAERALERHRLLRDGRRYKHELERRNVELTNRKAELERMQTQMLHTEKMASLGRLAAGIAHELNNPAGFIYGNMEVLRESIAALEQILNAYDRAQLPGPLAAEISAIKEEIDYQRSLEDLRSIVADCYSGADRIRNVVQNLRIFSRLDEAELKKVDLHEGLNSTIRLLSQYYSAGQIKVERDYGELPQVNCYGGQLNQVWMNLLTNAAQATGEGGVVRITTRLIEQTAVVSISDTGTGIAPENLKRIFEPFFTTKPVGEGTGLGLSISYGIIQRHGGQISVESQLGRGTEFTVKLPIDAEHAGNVSAE